MDDLKYQNSTTQQDTTLTVGIRAKWQKPETLPKNLLNIGRVTENEIMHLLESRYANDMIYTLMGDVQVAINPFKSIPHNLETYIKCKSNLSSLEKLEPHAFQIAAMSYYNLRRNKSDQSVIIQGRIWSRKD